MRRCIRTAIGISLVVMLLLFSCVASARPVRRKPPVKTTPASASQAYEVTVTSERWEMHDGVRLPVSVYCPVPRSAGERFPAVVFVHAWDMDKLMFDSTARGYASRGYVGVTYTVRGWFGAEGSVSCIDPDTDIRDLRDIITISTGDSRFPVKWDEKGPVVGVTGYSQGGVHTYLVAPRASPRAGDPCDPRIRAVAPMHGGADLLFSLYPNGALKWFWVTMLLAGGYIGNISGAALNIVQIIFDPSLDPWRKLSAILNVFAGWGQLFNNVTPELARVYAIAMKRELPYKEEAMDYMKKRSARWWCDQELDGVVEHPINVPTLIVTGWKDDLFNPNEGLGVFNSMVDAPRRIIVTGNGHAGGFSMPFDMPVRENPENRWVESEVADWFDHYLKGAANGVEKRPAVSYHRSWDTSSYGASDVWPPAGVKDRTLYCGSATGFREGKLADAPQPGAPPSVLLNTGFSGSVSIPYFNDLLGVAGLEPLDVPEKIDIINLPFQRYSYLTSPLDSDRIISGTPRLNITYQSSNQFTQLIPRLYEVTPDGSETLISRGWYEGYDERTWTRTGTGSQPVEMMACCYKVRAGSRLRLEFRTSDMVQTWPLWGFGFISIMHDGPVPSSITIPMM